MSERGKKCESCGAPALVRITGEDATGATMRYFCLHCADELDEPEYSERSPRLGAVFMGFGLFVLFISLFADWLAFGSSEGFGWQQLSGVTLAAALVLLGTVLRISTVLVIGLVIGCVALAADWLGFGGSEGFGFQQIAGVICGAVALGIGFHLARTTFRN